MSESADLQNAALHQVELPLDGQSYRHEIGSGACFFHLAAQVARRGVRVDLNLSSNNHVSDQPSNQSTATTRPSGAANPPSDYQGRNRQGAPFIPHPDFAYIGRDNSGCEFPGEQGPRMYKIAVNGFSRIYVVERTIRGSAMSSSKMDLLECQKADCEAFGYKYEGIIYLYGFHNHDDDDDNERNE